MRWGVQRGWRQRGIEPEAGVGRALQCDAAIHWMAGSIMHCCKASPLLNSNRYAPSICASLPAFSAAGNQTWLRRMRLSTRGWASRRVLARRSSALQAGPQPEASPVALLAMVMSEMVTTVEP